MARLGIVAHLREAVRQLLEDDRYRTAARHIQLAMQQVDGLEHAAEIIEETLGVRAAQRVASIAGAD